MFNKLIIPVFKLEARYTDNITEQDVWDKFILSVNYLKDREYCCVYRCDNAEEFDYYEVYRVEDNMQDSKYFKGVIIQ